MQPKIRAAKRIDPATAPKTHRIDVDTDDVRAHMQACRVGGTTDVVPCAVRNNCRKTLGQSGTSTVTTSIRLRWTVRCVGPALR